MTDPRTQRALTLFRHSVLKQAKLSEIKSMLGGTRGKRCLDIGSDNGVISLLLREDGGDWASADLDETTVDSIRELVGDDVHRIDGQSTPFPDACFDCVVIVDFLEHVHTDREFVRELRRIMKPEGRLIVNVPHIKPHSLLNRVRHLIGQTDERHGHVRPGYSRDSLGRTLRPWFTVERTRTYSRGFSELLDTVQRFAVDLAKGGGKAAPAGETKGAIVTGDDLARRRKSFGVLKLTYPLLSLFSRLDHLMFLQEGYKLIVRAKVAGDAGEDG
jgi:SAM-dependent methyltransferase